MSPNNIEEFENDLTQFFTDNIGNYSNWMVTLSTQSKLTSRQRRLGEHSRRHLQENDSAPQIEMVPLKTQSYVSSDNDMDDVDAFNDLLRETLNRNSTGFTLLLRSTSTIANQVYFARVENVEALVVENADTEMPSETSAPNGTLEPTETLPPASTEDEGSRLSAGAMAGRCW
jgi:hypothetical protein